MVSHRRDDSDLGMFFEPLGEEDSEIEVVGLTLLPDVMRSVVSSPQNQIEIHFLNFFEEQIKSLKG